MKKRWMKREDGRLAFAQIERVQGSTDLDWLKSKDPEAVAFLSRVGRSAWYLNGKWAAFERELEKAETKGESE